MVAIPHIRCKRLRATRSAVRMLDRLPLTVARTVPRATFAPSSSDVEKARPASRNRKASRKTPSPATTRSSLARAAAVPFSVPERAQAVVTSPERMSSSRARRMILRTASISSMVVLSSPRWVLFLRGSFVCKASLRI